MKVRREASADRATVEALHRAAFAGGNREVRILHGLRDERWFVPALSLVAVDDDEAVTGHVIASRAAVDGAPALGIGPVGVRPSCQRRGVGSALLHALVGAAQALDATVLVLLGDPAFYRRFGFVPAASLGIEAPEPAWGGYFQALTLTADAPRGAFRYADPFDDVGPTAR